MKKILSIGIIGASFVAAGPALAQDSASQSTTGSTTIVRAITMTKGSDLVFGRIVRPSTTTASTVDIAAGTGTRTLTGGDGVLLSGTTSRAVYNVAGEGGLSFSITVPATFNMTRTGGTETLTVTLARSATSGTLSGAAGAEGTATFGVGGSFSVASATATGGYTGTFATTVQYQ